MNIPEMQTRQDKLWCALWNRRRFHIPADRDRRFSDYIRREVNRYNDLILIAEAERREQLAENIDGFAAQIANGTIMSLSEAIRLGLLNDHDIPDGDDPDDYEVELTGQAVIGVDWAHGKDYSASVRQPVENEDGDTITCLRCGHDMIDGSQCHTCGWEA